MVETFYTVMLILAMVLTGGVAYLVLSRLFKEQQ